METSDVLLVGSLPFATAEEAVRAAGPSLRGHISCVCGYGRLKPERVLRIHAEDADEL